MDFLLHDVYLPGFAYAGAGNTIGQTRSDASSGHTGLLPSSLRNLLHTPRVEKDGDQNSRQHAVAGHNTDNEWQKQVLNLKLRQVGLFLIHYYPYRTKQAPIADYFATCLGNLLC